MSYSATRRVQVGSRRNEVSRRRSSAVVVTTPPASARPSRLRTTTHVHAELFAAGPDDPRGRRPSDLVRAVAYAALLVVASVLFVMAHDVDSNITRTLLGLPGFLDVFWLIAVWAAAAWAVTLLVITLARRRLRLTAEAVLAAAIAITARRRSLRSWVR